MKRAEGCMAFVYQAFVLDREWIEEERMRTGRLPAALTLEAANRVLGEMARLGYEVLEGSETLCGVPTTVIIGGRTGSNHKNDFYGLAEIAGLHFSSGDYFITRNRQSRRTSA